MKKILVAAAAAAALLTGCASHPAHSYDTTLQLRDAMVAAGRPCQGWRDDVKYGFHGAYHSADCSDIALGLFGSDAKQRAAIKEWKLVNQGDGSLLSGPGWLLGFNSPGAAADLQPAMGGEVIR